MLKENTTLSEVVSEIYERVNDVDAAAEELERVVRDNPMLRDELLNPLIRGACRNAIHAQIRLTRASIWSPPVAPVTVAREKPQTVNKDKPSRVAALAAGTLMMFPLPGGLRIMNATLEDLQKARDFYHSHATDMAHKARWLTLVMQKVDNGKKVVDCVTEDVLNALKAEAEA